MLWSISGSYEKLLIIATSVVTLGVLNWFSFFSVFVAVNQELKLCFQLWCRVTDGKVVKLFSWSFKTNELLHRHPYDMHYKLLWESCRELFSTFDGKLLSLEGSLVQLGKNEKFSSNLNAARRRFYSWCLIIISSPFSLRRFPLQCYDYHLE